MAIIQPTIKHYTVTVNYAGNKTIRKLLRKGRYDRVDDRITDKNFPTEKTGTEEVEIHTVHFGNNFATGDQVIEKLDKLDYKPANPAPLLALGKKYPDLQRQDPIVALGQCWFGPYGDCRYVVYLGRYLNRRTVFMNQFVGEADVNEGGWFDFWRFAAIPK